MLLKVHMFKSWPQKGHNINPNDISMFFSSTNPFKKYHETQKIFLEDIILFVIKGFLSLMIVESIWLHMLTYILCPWVLFPSRKIFAKEVLFALVQKPWLNMCNML